MPPFSPYLHTHVQLTRPSWRPGTSVNPHFQSCRGRDAVEAHQGRTEGRLQSPGPGLQLGSRCFCFLLACSVEKEECLPESPGAQRKRSLGLRFLPSEACWIPGLEQLQVGGLRLSHPSRVPSPGGLPKGIFFCRCLYFLRLGFLAWQLQTFRSGTGETCDASFGDPLFQRPSAPAFFETCWRQKICCFCYSHC